MRWWFGPRTVFAEVVRSSRLWMHLKDEIDKISDGFYGGRKKDFKRNEEWFQDLWPEEQKIGVAVNLDKEV